MLRKSGNQMSRNIIYTYSSSYQITIKIIIHQETNKSLVRQISSQAAQTPSRFLPSVSSR